MPRARNPSPSAPLRRSPPPPPIEGTAAECATAACFLCVCCPVAFLWCCLETPFRLTAAAARRLRRRRHRRSASPSCCCFRCGGLHRHRIVEASSSFSDHELDWLPPAHVKRR